MIWNISLSCLYRNLRPLVPPTLTPAKWWAAWKPNTRGLSMVWPSQRSGILTTPWAQRSPLKTRSECGFNHWMVTNHGAVVLAWIIILFVTFPDCKGIEADLWHNLLTKHRVNFFLFSTGSNRKASDLDWNTDFSVHTCSWVRGDAMSLTGDCNSILYWAIQVSPCDKVSCVLLCIDAYLKVTFTQAVQQSSCSENCKLVRREWHLSGVVGVCDLRWQSRWHGLYWCIGSCSSRPALDRVAEEWRAVCVYELDQLIYSLPYIVQKFRVDFIYICVYICVIQYVI